MDHLLHIYKLLSLFWYLLLFTTNHCQQILVAHINQTHSTHLYQPINNTLCIVSQNQSNPKSFLSYYILTNHNNNTITNYFNIKTTPISFYHIINYNNLPYSCIHQIQTQNKKSNTNNKNINHLQLPIASINGINKILTAATDNTIDTQTLDSSCPTQAWEFFIWSLKEWYLIYIFIILLGIIIGSIMIIIIVFCCWKHKKKKFIQQIITDYRNSKKQLKNAKKMSNSLSIDIENNKKHKRQKHLQKHASNIPKYALIDIDDPNNIRHCKSSHIIRTKRKDKKRERRKTLPTNLSDENSNELNVLSAEEDSLLTISRKKSNSEPCNPHRNSSRFAKNIKHKKHRKSNANPTHKSHSRSRSPWRERDKYKQSKNKYEQYKFTGNKHMKSYPIRVENNYNNKRRHSSKQKHKKQKRKNGRSKSPNNLKINNGNNKENISVIVNHIHHHNGNRNSNSNSYMNQLPPPIPQPMELSSTNSTKKSIGINLAKMKAKNYEDNIINKREIKRKSNGSLEMENLPNIPNEGNERESENEIEEKNAFDVTKLHKGHHQMPSLTNKNDEGIGIFDNVMCDTKVHINAINNILNDNANEHEESSSFTMKSKSNENGKIQEINEENVNGNKEVKNSNLLVPKKKSETKRYKLPKPITKGGWL